MTPEAAAAWQQKSKCWCGGGGPRGPDGGGGGGEGRRLRGRRRRHRRRRRPAEGTPPHSTSAFRETTLLCSRAARTTPARGLSSVLTALSATVTETERDDGAPSPEERDRDDVGDTPSPFMSVRAPFGPEKRAILDNRRLESVWKWQSRAL